MALLKRKRAGLNDAMSVVTRFVNACNRHDADGVAACLHPSFDSIQPMYPSRNFRGADQVRRNWQAIFDAEPGFRLTVLRSAAMDDTVWLELHGAGREAEVAGVFVMGIQGDRIRWARIYSALVEPVPAGVGEETPPAPLREVGSLDQHPAAANGEMVEEPLIAPVLDIDRSSRRRRRRRGSEDDAEAAAAPAAEEGVPAEAGAALEDEAASETGEQVEAEVGEVVEMVEVEPEVVVVVEEEVDVAPAAEAVVTESAVTEAVVTGADVTGADVTGADVTGADVTGADVAPATEAADDDGGPPTEAVEMVALTDPDPDPDPEPEPEPDFGTLPPPQPEAVPKDEAPASETPKRRFGKRLRP